MVYIGRDGWMGDGCFINKVSHCWCDMTTLSLCRSVRAVKGKIHLLEIIHISAFKTGQTNDAAETNCVSVFKRGT